MQTWNWGKPLIEGFNNSPQKGYSESEQGLLNRKLNFTDIYDKVNCSFTLTKAEYINFINWYQNDLRQGTLPFLFFDCRFQKQRVARFIEDIPQYTSNSNRFNLTVSLAFMSEVLSQEFFLIVNEDNYLIVNDNDYLLANQLLRV